MVLSSGEGNHNVLLAVTGSIAAFKGAKLASDLVKEGYAVRVIVTAGGARFVSALTFEAITGAPAGTDVWDEQPGSSRMGHLELARWADILVVAPASANALARLALGLADDLLGAVALACRAPLIIAPAMETGMYTHPATQEHLRTLQSRGAQVVGPESGRLASGVEGEGRMSEPDVIVEAIRDTLRHHSDLAGHRVIVTAGPTFEPIDPVRFIGNRSSGKMGYAIAEEARDRGAEVVLITGPTSLPPPHGMETVRVERTAEMRQAVLDRVLDANVIVMAAAVADFTPAVSSSDKLKRRDALSLQLAPTADIAAEASAAAPEAIHVGFALESRDHLAAAREKLLRKRQHLVVANQISDKHNPFGADTNLVAFVTRDSIRELPAMPKRDVARLLWDEVLKLEEAGSGGQPIVHREHESG